MSNTVPDDDPEVKKDSTVHMTKVSAPDLMQEVVERLSSWDRLKRTVAWLLRYKSTLHRFSKKRRAQETVLIETTSKIVPITVAKLNNAEVEILKRIQSQCFKEQRDCLNLKSTDQRTNSSRQIVVKKI